MDRQLQHESESWLRTLDFIKEENVHLKHRLSEMVRLRSDKQLLSQAEAFQNFFLNMDTVIALAKNDIKKHQQLLTRDIKNGEELLRKVLKSQQVFRADMEKLEKEFCRLNIDFNTFASDLDWYQLALPLRKEIAK